MRAPLGSLVAVGLTALLLVVSEAAPPPGDRPSAPPSAADPAPPARRVLLLYSNRADLPANVLVDQSIRARLGSGIPGAIDVHAEYLDVTRFPEERQRELERNYLRDRYAGKPIDLIVAISRPAINLLIAKGDPIFAGVPVVFGLTETRAMTSPLHPVVPLASSRSSSSVPPYG